MIEGKTWSKKYKKYVRWWTKEYRGAHYQLLVQKELLPSETEYASFGLTYRLMKYFIEQLANEYGPDEVEKELNIKIK